MRNTPVKQTKSPERTQKDSSQGAPGKKGGSSPNAKKQLPKAVGNKTQRRSMTPPHSPPSPHEGSYTETFESSTSKMDDALSDVRDIANEVEPMKGWSVASHDLSMC